MIAFKQNTEHTVDTGQGFVMKLKWLGCVLLFGISVSTGSAGVVNGAVDAVILHDAASINVASDLDEGWHAWSASIYDLTEHDIWSTWLINQPDYWFGQIFTDQYTTYGVGSFSFDVTYMGGNIKSPMFEYAIFGTDSTNASNTALTLNANANPAESAWSLISGGTVSTPAAGSYQADINFGDTAYKYLGIRFRFAGTTCGRGTDYATAVDNISVIADHAIVPEPAAIALAGLGGVIMLVVKRVGRNRPTV